MPIITLEIMKTIDQREMQKKKKKKKNTKERETKTGRRKGNRSYNEKARAK